MKMTLTSLIVATLTLPAVALASKLSKPQVELSKLTNIPQNIKTFEQKPDIKKIPELKILEQNFLNGVEKLRLGTNSGGGGDDIGLDFQRTLQAAFEGLRKQSPTTFDSLKKRGILTTFDQVKVIVVDEDLEVLIKGYTQNSVAVNLPEMKTILVNRQRWGNIRDNNIKEGIALHEILSLLKIESTGNYTISSKYVAIKGGATKELTSSLQVNRLQQIRSLDKTMSDGEILKLFFDEASEPISMNDFIEAESFAKGPITSVACAQAGPQEQAWPYKYRWVKKLTVTKAAIPPGGRPALGPLLPEIVVPGVPAEEGYRIGTIHLKQSWPWDFVVVPEIKHMGSEIIQIWTFEEGSAATDKKTEQFRKNNGLIVMKETMLFGRSQESRERYTYCYPVHQ